MGGVGDATVWSFELSKTISVGWGGLISVNGNLGLSEKIKLIRTKAGYHSRKSMSLRLFQGGMSGLFYHHSMPLLLTKYLFGPFVKLGLFKRSADTKANNLKMPSDQQWNFLLQQFDSLEEITARSRYIAGIYDKVLSENNCQPSWSSVSTEGTSLIRYPFFVSDRKGFVNHFSKKSIEVGQWFSSPVSGISMLENFEYVEGSCPVAEWICVTCNKLTATFAIG